MKMAAVAGNGDEQDRIEGSTAHDPADGDDSFSFKSLIFPVLLLMQLSTEPPSSEGAMDGGQRLSRQHDNRKDNYGRNCNPHFMVRACAKDPILVIPAGRAISAEGGMAVHRGDDT